MALGGEGGGVGDLSPIQRELSCYQVSHHWAYASWVTHFPSLSLSFFICKMGIMIHPEHKSGVFETTG